MPRAVFFFAAFFAYIAGSPFLFQNIYGISPQIYGFIFGGIGVAVSLAGVLPVRLAGRVPDHKVLVWTLFQSIGGSLLFLIACYTKAALPLVILSLLTGIPLVSILGAVSFSLAMKAQGEQAGSASALLGFFSMVAGGLAAPLVGIAGEGNALPMALLMLSGCLAAYASYARYIAPAHRNSSR